MKKEAILFDLDGTLLPMQMDKFVNKYFSELTKKICPFGYDKELLVSSIWKGTYAMVKNNGTVTNEELFWNVFSELMGESIMNLEEEFADFYINEFNIAKDATKENPMAAQAIIQARKKANQVILATNPIFPLCAVETRLSWIGISPSDFDYVTSYENSSYSKPNPNYYREIMRKRNTNPESCLMIGNDLNEDIIASSEIGISTFLVTDCLIAEGKDVSETKNGTFIEMIEFLNTL